MYDERKMTFSTCRMIRRFDRKAFGSSLADSKQHPAVPMRKKIKNLTEELLRGPPLSDFPNTSEEYAADAPDWANDDAPEGAEDGRAAASVVKTEAGGQAEVRRSGGFARVDAQGDARLRAIAEQASRAHMRCF